MDNFTFSDLFCGIGGFRLALENKGGKCVFSCEIDKFAKQTYKANFNEIPSGDITKINEKDISTHDILVGGFPCQSFSIAGKRKGFDDTRGTLFFDILRILKKTKPKAFILENVDGLLSHDNGKTFNIILESLAKTINGQESLFKTDNLDYHIFWKILNAKDYGVPQNRKRVFIIGFKEFVNFKFPSPIFLKNKLKDILETEVHEKYYLSEKAIKGVLNHAAKHQLKGNGFQPNFVNKYTLFSNTIPARYYKDGSNCLIIESKKSSQGMRINSIDNYSVTLSSNGGGRGAKTGLYSIGDKVRRLTPRECARLMGLPDSFKIVCSDSQSYKQFGNGVVVPVVEAILKNLLPLI